VTGPTVEELNAVNDPDERRARGAIRRLAIKVTSRVLWQLVGYKIDTLVETWLAEPFTGIGFYSRPPRDGRPEAIAVYAGGAASPAVVALRDEKTRARMAGDLAEGDAALYSGTVGVYAKQSGTVEIRSGSVPAVESTIKGDTFLQALDLMLTALAPAIAGIVAGPITAPTAGLTSTAATAIETFQAALAAYKTTVAKVQ
jgi:phage gp45-like